MKLKCIYSRNDAFTVGKEYKATVISKDRDYFFIIDKDNILRSVPLDGCIWGFEIVPIKASVTVEQALQDGFVKVKSLKRCLKEGIVNKEVSAFINCPSVPDPTPDFRIDNRMIASFGQVLEVRGNNENGLWLKDPILINIEWSWPIEAIEK
jgi:hypothetical protein